jgi:taurine dioxygenase
MKNFPEIFEINTDKNSKIANGAEDFHSDVSCDIEPPLGTMLQLHVLPECGGDTMFANMYLAYEALSKPMQVFLGGLKASHESEHFYKGRYQNKNEVNGNKEYPSAIHPIIRTHPETGKKAIYVNKFFTTRIEGLADQESKLILDYLFSHIEKTEFQIRYKWNKNDIAFWDNRCTIHKALWDYFPNERKGRRVTIKGSVPF